MEKKNESFMRASSKKQMEDLNRTIQKSGGDIADKVRRSEQTKEDKMPNSMYMDNPFNSNRKVDSYEEYQKATANKKTPMDALNDPKRGKVTESKDEKKVSGSDIVGIAKTMKKLIKGEENLTEADIKKLLPVEYKKISTDDFEKVLSALVDLDIDLKVDESKKTKKEKKKKTEILDFKKFSDGSLKYISGKDKDRPMLNNLPDGKEAE